MKVLVCLASRPGEPVSKETILNTVWADSFVTENVLTRTISELRRAFADNARQPIFIQTIPKRGYRLVASVGTANRNDSDAIPAVRPDIRKKWFSATAAIVALLITCVLIFRANYTTRLARASASPVPVGAHEQDVPASASQDRSGDPAPRLKKRAQKLLHADPVFATPGSKKPPVTVVTVLNNTNVSQSESTASSQTAAEKVPLRMEALFQNISPDLAGTRVRHSVLPKYPPSAVQAHIAGTVEIGIAVSPKGDVSSARVLIGHPVLIAPAIEAIRQWTFEPNRVRGELTWSRMRALVRFLPDGTTAVAFGPPLLADSYGDLGAQRDEVRDGAILPVIRSAE